MDNLPIWAVWIAAGAVGLAPMLVYWAAEMILHPLRRISQRPRGREPVQGRPGRGSRWPEEAPPG